MMREVSGAKEMSYRGCLAHCNASSGYITLLHHTASFTSRIAAKRRKGHRHPAEKILITAGSLCLFFLQKIGEEGGGCKMGSLVPTEDEYKFCIRQHADHQVHGNMYMYTSNLAK